MFSVAANMYATLIIAGRKAIDEVLEKHKKDTKGALIERGYPELAEEESNKEKEKK